MHTEKGTVAVIGASPKPERYSNQAVRMLRDHGYPVAPIRPGLSEIEGIPAHSSISEVSGPIDTVSLYVNPTEAARMKERILQSRPRRVIFNPGTFDEELDSYFRAQGVETVRGCTLVMLRTGQF